jgi:hypothetical protein
MNIGLIFGMIITIIIMVAILVFGYVQITSIQRLQQEAEFKRVLKSLADSVDLVYSLSGETSERFTLAFPSNVQKVCFIPFFSIEEECRYGSCEEYREMYTEYELKYDLEEVVTGLSSREEDQLVQILINQREGKMQPLLVFFTSGTPEWEGVPHLGPSKADDEVLCVSPRTQLWLKRHFDDEGAWVDVEEI